MSSSSAPGATSEPSTNTSFSASEFFSSQPPPPSLASNLDLVRTFVEAHSRASRRIVLVTSGGTTVPLEHNVVRFLDNFSAGTRGAASAEYFLRTGKYAVIFLHRTHSLQPFSRHYSHSVNPFLDLLEFAEDGSTVPQKGEGADLTDSEGPLFPALSPSTTTVFSSTAPQISISGPHLPYLHPILSSYKLVHKRNLLLSISFTTVQEYLFTLRGTALILGDPTAGLGRRALYYLAAAVSDFWIPQWKMSEHKIQSGKGSLTIEMDQVPKILRPLVQEWSHDGFIVSFKLETDPTLLIPKARAALSRYGHRVVVGNDLNRRKFEVVFVEPDDGDGGGADGAKGETSKETWVRVDKAKVAKGDVEIEEEIVSKLVEMHERWIESGDHGADASRRQEPSST